MSWDELRWDEMSWVVPTQVVRQIKGANFSFLYLLFYSDSPWIRWCQSTPGRGISWAHQSHANIVCKHLQTYPEIMFNLGNQLSWLIKLMDKINCYTYQLFLSFCITLQQHTFFTLAKGDSRFSPCSLLFMCYKVIGNKLLFLFISLGRLPFQTSVTSTLCMTCFSEPRGSDTTELSS